MEFCDNPGLGNIVATYLPEPIDRMCINNLIDEFNFLSGFFEQINYDYAFYRIVSYINDAEKSQLKSNNVSLRIAQPLVLTTPPRFPLPAPAWLFFMNTALPVGRIL